MGALTGAIGGLFGDIGYAAGAASGAAGGAAGSVLGSAAGGAVSAAVTGGDVGMGALTGAISGIIAYGVGQLQITAPNDWIDDLAGFAVSSGAGALGGGIGAVLQGGSFWDGAAGGAIGGAIGYAFAVELPDAINNAMSENPRVHLFAGLLLDAVPQSWLDGAASFGAGLGDVLSFGATKFARGATGLDERVNQGSGLYTAGSVTGAAAMSLATAGTTGATGIASQAGKSILNKTITRAPSVGKRMADRFLGQNSRAIVERGSGKLVGRISSDGQRVIRFPHRDSGISRLHWNLEDKGRGLNLHVIVGK